MASWNEKNEGDELDECNICLCQVAKKRFTVHLNKCLETFDERLDTEEMGYLIRCPFYARHVIPSIYLNHHLEYNCEEVQNLLKKFIQKEDLRNSAKVPPKEFLAHVPDNILNQNNKRLLYLLDVDFDSSTRKFESVIFARPAPILSTNQGQRSQKDEGESGSTCYEYSNDKKAPSPQPTTSTNCFSQSDPEKLKIAR